MATLADLQQTIQAIKYAKQAYDTAKLGTSLYSAATAAAPSASAVSSAAATEAGLLGAEGAGMGLGTGGLGASGAAAAGAGVGTATGFGALMAPIAIVMLVNSLVNAAEAKNRQKTKQGQVKQMQEAAGVMQGLATPAGKLREWLDTQTYGARRGDLLYDIAKRNLRGDYASARADMAPGGVTFEWAPNTAIAPVVAVLEKMGYTNPVKDPAGLISRSGGWTGDKDKYGLPREMDTQKGVANWDSLLSNLGNAFKTLPGAPQAAKAYEPKVEDMVQIYNARYGSGGGAGALNDAGTLKEYIDAGAPYAKEVAAARGTTPEELQQGYDQLQKDREYYARIASYIEPGGGA